MELPRHIPESIAREAHAVSQYAREAYGLRSEIDRHLGRSRLDAPSKALASAFFDDFYNASSDGVHYRLSLLALIKAASPTTTSDEKVAAALLIPLIRHVDNLIDRPDFPHFDSPQDLKKRILEHPVLLKRHITSSIADVSDIVVKTLNPEDRQLYEDFLDHASETHWRYAPLGRAGEYGFEDALAYRRATTVRWYKTVKQILNTQDPPEHEPALASQYLDDAWDVASDVRDNRINMWAGMAKDRGELDALLAAISAPSRFPNPVRERGIRRKTPSTFRAYSAITAREIDKSTNRHFRTLGHAFLLTI